MSHNKIEANNTIQLKKLYKTRKTEILKRLGCFKNTWNKNNNRIFSELCFCILTPQSKAEACNEIINKLVRNHLLFKGDINQIRPHLKKQDFIRINQDIL